MATLKLINAGKTYPNGYVALSDINLDVKDGEFTVLVGPSGCGKSTLLRMVAGLEEVTTGDIMIGDRVVNNLDPASRKIAMVFQNYALYPHMTVYNNMAYGLKNLGTPKEEIRERVNYAAKLLGIEEYLPRRPRQLSGGQRQRVAMGRAIVRKPDIFLFDEPLSNLDAKLRSQMRIEIRKLQRELSVTALYVTHDQVEAMTMADTIVVLSDGHIEQIGTPKQIYHHPNSTFVAEFIGSPPMNLLKATHTGNGTISLPGDNQITIDRKDLAEGELLLGIRPEDIEIAASKSAKTLGVEVELVEELGAGNILHTKLGTSPIVISPRTSFNTEKQQLEIKLPDTKLHFFASADGKRL